MCILIVEDEDLILDIMAETLTDAGYDVMTASTGPQAVALIEAGKTKFSALFSDFHLPGGLTGLDVATAIRRRFPALPVILATGRPDVLEKSWRPGENYVLLQKPYGPSQMLRELGRLVAPHRPSQPGRA